MLILVFEVTQLTQRLKSMFFWNFFITAPLKKSKKCCFWSLRQTVRFPAKLQFFSSFSSLWCRIIIVRIGAMMLIKRLYFFFDTDSSIWKANFNGTREMRKNWQQKNDWCIWKSKRGSSSICHIIQMLANHTHDVFLGSNHNTR